MLAHDRPGIEGWQWLGFSLAAVDGVRELAPVDGGAEGGEVRRASAEDADKVAALVEALERHLAAAPIFWPHTYQDAEKEPGAPGPAWWLAYDEQPGRAFLDAPI